VGQVLLADFREGPVIGLEDRRGVCALGRGHGTGGSGLTYETTRRSIATLGSGNGVSLCAMERDCIYKGMCQWCPVGGVYQVGSEVAGCQGRGMDARGP